MSLFEEHTPEQLAADPEDEYKEEIKTEILEEINSKYAGLVDVFTGLHDTYYKLEQQLNDIRIRVDQIESEIKYMQ